MGVDLYTRFAPASSMRGANFGAYWTNENSAFNRFACSYDLVHWTDWAGADLIRSLQPYDNLYAHKSFVVQYKGIVY